MKPCAGVARRLVASVLGQGNSFPWKDGKQRQPKFCYTLPAVSISTNITPIPMTCTNVLNLNR